jgi:hypothetical protein
MFFLVHVPVDPVLERKGYSDSGISGIDQEKSRLI